MASEDTALAASCSQDRKLCRNFQAKLKSKALQISESLWTQSAQVFTSEKATPSYVPLVLRTRGPASSGSKLTKGRGIRPEKLKTHEPTEQNISPDDLLKSHKRKILLVGRPGVGKTVVARRILKLWAEEDNEEPGYMFYFDARETASDAASRKLEDLLFGGFSEPDGGKEEVWEDVRTNSGRVTIIFDGVTPLLAEFVQGNLLPDAKIIITCRPEFSSQAFLVDWDPFRVEVEGFGEQSIRDYLSRLLSEEHSNKILRNSEFFTLCSVPAYALMMAACFCAEGYFPQPCTRTRLHLQFLRRCVLQIGDETSEIDGDQILRLAEAAFCSTQEKDVNLPSLHQPDSFAHAPFLNLLRFQGKKRLCSFFHSTFQEFFAALWLVENPGSRRVFLQEWTTERLSHMKHLLPFMCGLLNSKNRETFCVFFPSQQPKDTSDQVLKDLVTTCVERRDTEDSGKELPLLCQCLYESQSPAACLQFLDKLDYGLVLSEERLGSQQCCAVSYVVRQSGRKVQLNLKDATVSGQGASLLVRCLSNVQRNSLLSHKLWRISLLAEGRVDYRSLLCFDENWIRLPVHGERRLLQRAAEAIQESVKKVKVGLYREERSPTDTSLSEVLPQCFPDIDSISVLSEMLSEPSEETRMFGDLFCAAAQSETETGEKILEQLASVCTYKTFPLRQKCLDFLLDLSSYDAMTFSCVLPALQSVLQSAASVWDVDLSEGRSSVLLEVLKVQPEKKEVQLTGFSREESEVRSFLQCLPFISQLSAHPYRSALQEGTRFFGSLLRAAAERESETGEKMLERLASACTYETFPLRSTFVSADDDDYRTSFLLDLLSHVKDSEEKSGLSVLPALQSVLQSVSSFWAVNLSERRSSFLLEVLKLQPEKKEVQLTGFSREESEVRSFLQCLPFISQLSVRRNLSDLPEGTRFFGNLFCAAAGRDNEISELFVSVCAYKKFPLRDTFSSDDDEDYRSDFLLDLFTYLKESERDSGLSVVPALRSVLQSAPSVWSINLSEGRSSVLLEVLKLQPEKKEVQLTGFPHEQSVVRSFLLCLPFISQLSVHPNVLDLEEETRFFGSLFCAAAKRENQTGEKILERVASVCTYKKFPLRQIFWSDEEEDDDDYRSAFLLDLLSRVKNFEKKSGSSVVPALQSVWHSAPSFWSINLSERRSSVLLEVLKLQPEKKEVHLTGFSHKGSEMRSFLRCLPFISRLSCAPDFFQRLCSSTVARCREAVQQLASLLELLSFTLTLTGELNRKTCSNMGRVLQLCGRKVDVTLAPSKISVRQTADIFEHTGQLQKLRLSNHMTLLLFRWIRRGRVARSLAVEELSLLACDSTRVPEAEWLKVASGLASLLRYWSVRRLDLTQSYIPARCLVSLLLHEGSLSIRLNTKTQQQLLAIVHKVQDEGLTSSFLAKVDGDLTSCTLNWEILRCLLQQSPQQTITVDLSSVSSLEETPDLLFPFLDRIRLQRPSPSFVMTSINALYRDRASFTVPALLRAFDHVIDLSGRELDLDDSSALFFILNHASGVHLNLLHSSIPAERRNSIVIMLDRVSHLSVDRKQLLELVRCCAASYTRQKAASDLLSALQHRLDFCTLAPKEELLRVSTDDCRAVSSILQHSAQQTLLDLRDCELQRDGLNLLFSVLDGVRLRVSKDAVLQLFSLVPVTGERDARRRAQSLCNALGRQLDLSRTPLDERACADLVRVLELSEGLKDLDLSHCRLTDHLLLLFSSQMRKVQVLDLCHNEITDASTPLLLQVLSNNPSIKAVRIFGNKISDRAAFQREERLQIWWSSCQSGGHTFGSNGAPSPSGVSCS